MPHLGSNTIRALYDVSIGGEPRAFECMLCSCGGTKGISCTLATDHNWCQRRTRTLRGMRTHQRVVHGIKEQSEFNFGEIKATI